MKNPVRIKPVKNPMKVRRGSSFYLLGQVDTSNDGRVNERRPYMAYEPLTSMGFRPVRSL